MKQLTSPTGATVVVNDKHAEKLQAQGYTPKNKTTKAGGARGRRKTKQPETKPETEETSETTEAETPEDAGASEADENS